ncbi:RNA chaperone Hfq [Proteiniclasticum sp. BAD-10]|uniref:RNA-binding protein Hfq n=1 Tax=Proteiniclasticum sediminis TaxID=2804028 RepID=A0A941CNT5_9CLOT|nr:RNA chaperone Hfq [Proteiniclasticum sediminis]MBR0574924.1 RNA chaperone Hfq [Proteiniclasticum sediminis]
MNKVINNFQDVFLNSARKSKTLVTIHLVNGFQLKGMVKGFDNYVIVLDSDGKQMMVYKHAVTTITPSRPLLTMEETEAEE